MQLKANRNMSNNYGDERNLGDLPCSMSEDVVDTKYGQNGEYPNNCSYPTTPGRCYRRNGTKTNQRPRCWPCKRASRNKTRQKNRVRLN